MKALLLNFKVKDTESVNWSKALASYLKKSYGSSAWSQFFDVKQAENLDRLRNNANGSLAPEALVEQNLLYYAFLEQLYLRLGASSRQFNIDYTWYDAAYTPTSGSQKYTQRTVAFEKSSVLYNLAAVMTLAAKDQVESDMKSAIGFMTRAYACFEFLSENFLNSPSVDLQADNTKFLANICHAQAQELFLLRIINGQDTAKHASLIAKLASMTSSLYEKANSFYEASSTTPTSETTYGETKWKSIVLCKAHFYKSVSAYNYGIALEQQNKFGEAIAFLKLAEDAIVSTMVHKLYVKETMDLEPLKTLIMAKHKNLIKDNDFIYHDSVPSDASMENIKSMDAVKAPPLAKLLEPYMEKVAESSDILFRGIIPLEVYEKESIYSELKANLLREEVEGADTADWEYKSFVEFTTLPKILRDLENRYTSSGKTRKADNPQLAMMREHLESWSSSVLKSPYQDVESQMHSVVELRKQILVLLGSIPQEQQENAVKLKSSLVAASNSDQKLFSFVQSHMKELQLLKNPAALEKKWAELTAFQNEQPDLLDIDDNKNDEIKQKIKNVADQHEDLKVLKDERASIVLDLKKAVNDDDITRVIIMNRGITDNELKKVFDTELEKFKPLITRIEATIFKQRNLINTIKIGLDGIFKLTGVDEESSKKDPNLARRNELYNGLNQAFANFSVFANDLPKGLSFYESLLKMAQNLQSFDNNRKEITHTTAPALPDQLSQNFQQLKIASNTNWREGNAAENLPAIPPQAYGVQDRSPLSPPVPPKQPPSGISGLSGLQNPASQMEQNPTSFYNNPSVFDESLYSRFSG
ncbi:LAME_0H07382g1_1 [Lachancea meyersii CBS 8951]|uniref:BRO domain-containing protein 1 n=1 Tax=Lachancea meyersii CBS 8951 TaxID=1266667 RepID=A0A1G4KES5_9SACH|nr:LAME_0H07382g1_1 [Lachancea meyersii CBS 8951]